MTEVYKDKHELFRHYIQKNDTVLDVGFWGQAVSFDDKDWVHAILLKEATEVYGVDLVYDESRLENKERYQKARAENFRFNHQFDVIVASELIEHLENPGLFLERCKDHLATDGKLILTTPNAFSFMNMVQKLVKGEPPVNPDHTFYFNKLVLERLLKKCGFVVEETAYVATFPTASGFKRLILRFLYRAIALFTPKYLETLVVLARKN